MATETGMPAAAETQDTPRTIDTPEFIDRLAENMRHSSGSELPHLYYVEQVKLQLAGDPAFDKTLAAAANAPEKSDAIYHGSDCFKAWAIPE